MNNWIEHLQHPLVLAGFGLFIFAALVRPLFLNNKKLSGTATERLLGRGINFVFVLALLAMMSGFALSWKTSPAGGGQHKISATPVQPVAQQPKKEQKGVPSVPKEPTADTGKGAALSITASGQGQVTVGGDVINAQGNVEKNDAR